MAKMTLKQFYKSNKTIFIHFSAEKQLQKFFQESDRLGKTWKSGDKFVNNKYDDALCKTLFEYNMCISNKGTFDYLDIIKCLGPVLGYCILEFDEIDFENEAKGENKQINQENDIFVELKDTITMMTSDDYKERFKAEYYQVKIRYEKLLAMMKKWRKGELSFTPTCPTFVYEAQLKAMKDYLTILIFRAEMEEIELCKKKH